MARRFLRDGGGGAGARRSVGWEGVFANDVLRRDILGLVDNEHDGSGSGSGSTGVSSALGVDENEGGGAVAERECAGSAPPDASGAVDDDRGGPDGDSSPPPPSLGSRKKSPLFSSSPKDLTVALPEAYAVRYLPLFLLRAAMAPRSASGAAGGGGEDRRACTATAPASARRDRTNDVLRDSLLDADLIRARTNVLGPYFATMIHLADWDSYISLCRWGRYGARGVRDGDDDDNKDGVYVALHRAITKALVDGMTDLLDGIDSAALEAVVGKSGGGKGAKSSSDFGAASDADPAASIKGGQSIGGKKKGPRRPYDSMAVAFCVEVGRSLHHLGVNLGRRQQERESSTRGKRAGRSEDGDQQGAPAGNETSIESDTSQQRGDENDDGDANGVVILEVMNYQTALKAYRSALDMLKDGESTLRSTTYEKWRNRAGRNKQRLENVLFGFDVNANDPVLWEYNRQVQLHSIRETKISIELHLADTLSCLGYCHDAKLAEYDRAALAYKECLALYSRHVSKHHIVVSNALHNLGTIHVELQQWKEAARCYKECISNTKRTKEEGEAKVKELGDGAVFESAAEDEELAGTLQCLGKVHVELKEFEKAEACFQESVDYMKSAIADAASTHFDSRHQLVASALSAMGGIFVQRSSDLASKWHAHNEQQMISQRMSRKDYTREDTDSLLAQLVQAQKRAVECFEESVSIRRGAVPPSEVPTTKLAASGDQTASCTADDAEIESDSQTYPNMPNSENTLELAHELVELGRLSFRQRSYDGAISYLNEALAIYNEEPSHAMMNESRSASAILVLTIMSNAYSRLVRYDKSMECLEKAANILEGEKGRSTNEGSSDSTPDNTDMDLASTYHRMGLIFYQKGNHEAAIKEYEKALRMMEATADNARSQSEREKDGDSGPGVLSVDLSTKSGPLLLSNSESGDVKSDGTHGTTTQHTTWAMRTNFALCQTLFAMGQAYHEEKEHEKALKCLEDGMKYHIAIQDYKSSLQDMPLLQSTWPLILSDQRSRTFWGVSSSVMPILLIGDVYERVAQISLEMKKDDDAFEYYERSIQIRRRLCDRNALATLRDEECDLYCLDMTKLDDQLMSCSEYILRAMPSHGKNSNGVAHRESSVFQWARWKKNSTIEGQEFGTDEATHLVEDDVLFGIGNIHAKRLQHESAIDCYTRAEKLAAARLGTRDHIIVANILFKLGNVYKIMLSSSGGGLDSTLKDDAIRSFEESLRIYRLVAGSNQPSIAASARSLAEVYMCVSEDIESPSNKEALRYFKESLSQKRLHGGMNLDVASTQHLLGVLYVRKGAESVGEALDALTEAFAARKALLPQNDLDLCETINEIGKAHRSRATEEDLDLALSSFSEVLRIRRHARGMLPEERRWKLSFGIAQSLLNIADCKLFRGTFDEAKDVYKDALAEFTSVKTKECENDQNYKRETSVDACISMTWRNLARLHYKCGRLDESISCYKTSLECLGLVCTRDDDIRNDSLVTDAEEIAALKMELAIVYEKRGQLEVPLRLYTWCSKVCGSENTLLGKCLYQKGRLHLLRKEYEVAVSSMTKALCIYELNANGTEKANGQIQEVDQGLLHSDLAHGLKEIDGHDKEALDHYRSAVSILEEVALQPSTAARTTEGIEDTETPQSLQRRLLRCYKEMLLLTPGIIGEDEDEEEETFDILHRTANLHAALGEHEEAKLLYEQVIAYQRKMSKDDENALSVADLLFNLGSVLFCMGDFERSLECHEESQSISEGILGEDDVHLAENMQCLGNVASKQGDFEDALHWYSAAEKLMRQQDDSEQDEGTIATILHKKGRTLERLGKRDAAMFSFKTALEICKRMGDLDTIEVSDMLNSLGNSYNPGNLKKAMKLYEQSLHIRVRVGDALSVANTENNMGAVFHARGDIHHAMLFFSRALRAKTLQLGCDHAETARSLSNIGQIYLEQKEFVKAHRCFAEGLRILRLRLGEDDCEVAVCLYNLGVALDESSDPTNALKAYLDAIEIFNRAGASDHVTLGFSLHNAGIIYSKRGDFERSAQFLRNALHSKASTLGPDHDDTLDTRFCLANVLRELDPDQLDEAMKQHGVVLKARVKRLGKDHIDTANVLVGLSQIHRRKGENEEAASCLMEALRVNKINFGADNEAVADLELTAGDICRDLGDHDAAIDYFTDARKIKVQTHGEDHFDVSSCSSRLGACLYEKGRLSEALDSYQDTLRILQCAVMNDDFEMACMLENAGLCQQKLGRHERAIESFEKALSIKQSAPAFRDLTFLIGKSNYALGNFGKALQFFSESVQWRKENKSDLHAIGEALLHKASVYKSIGETSRTINIYTEIIESGYFLADSWEMGQTYQRLGQSNLTEGLRTDALKETGEALRIFEHNADIAFDREKYKEIADAYEASFELHMTIYGSIGADGGDLCYKLADAYVQMAEHQMALHWFSEGIRIQKDVNGQDHLSLSTGFYNRGNCLLDLGELNESILCLEESLRISLKVLGKDNEIVADTYHSLALAHQTNSDFRQALSLYEKSQKILAGLFGASNPRLGSTVANMGECFEEVGEYNAGMSRCKEALSMYKRQSGGRDSNIANVFECLGKIHRHRGELEKSLQCFHETLMIRKGTLGEDHILVSKVLSELALVHASRGEEEKSREIDGRAIEICEHHLEQIGCVNESESHHNENPHESSGGLDGHENEGMTDITTKDVVAINATSSKLERTLLKCKETSKSNMLSLSDTVLFYGKLLQRRGRIEEAKLCFGFSLKNYSKKLDPNHLSIGDIFHHQGMLLALRGHYSKASKAFLDALQVREARLMDLHPDTEETLRYLGTIQSELGNAEKAIYYLSDAMARRESRLGRKVRRDDQADTLLRLGKLHQEKGEHAEARDAYEEAYRARLRTKGRKHKDVGEVLFALGNLFLDMGKSDLALLRLEDALKCYEQSEDENSSEIGDVLFSLGILHYEQERLDQAMNAYQRCLLIRKKGDKSDAPCAQALTNLGCVFLELKEYEKAQMYHVEALRMMEESLGKNHEDVAYCWYSLGSVYLEDDKSREALSCFTSALQIQRYRLDKDHIDVGNSLHMLGRCLVAVRDKDKATRSFVEALRIRTMHLGNNDEDVGETHRFLAKVEVEIGEEEKALANFIEAIRIKMIWIDDKKSFDNSEYDSLMECFDGAKKVIRSRKGSDNIDLASLLQRKGICQGLNKNHLDAIDSYMESLRIYKKVYGGDNHLTIGNILYNMGVCFNECGDIDKAIKCLTKAHAITCRFLGEDHTDVADIDFQMGTSYKLNADYSAAVKSYEKSLMIRKQFSGMDSPEVASIMDHIGDICFSNKDMEKAERCYRECLRIRRNRLGSDSIVVSKSLAKMGAVHRSKGEYPPALRCYEDSLAKQMQLSKDKEETADLYFDVGSVHDLMQSDRKALFCYDQTIRIYTEDVCQSNLAVAKALSNKAAIILSMGHDDQTAMNTYRKALEIRKRCLGEAISSEPSEELADILWGQGELYDRLGEPEKSRSHYENALAMYQKSVGHESAQVARCIQCIAVHFLKGGNYDQAHYSVKEALRLRESIYGVPDEDIADSMLTLGTILFTWHDYDNALPYLEQACSIHSSVRGEHDLSVANASFLIGCINESSKEYDKAVNRFKDALQGRRRSLGPDHAEVAQVLNRTGKIHIYLKESDLAAICFEEALRIGKLASGPTSAEVAEYLLNLGKALSAEDETQRAMECIDEAFRAYKFLYGEFHPSVAKSMSSKATILEKRDDLSSSKAWYKKAVKIYDEVLPEKVSKEDIADFHLNEDYLDLAETLSSWAVVEDRDGGEMAMNLYRRASKLYKALLGENDLQVAKVLNNMANMLGRQEKYDKAMALLDQALTIRKDQLGEDHPDVAAVLFGMGVAHDKKQEYDQAKSAYEECMRIQRLEFGPESLEVATTLENYGIVKGNSNDLQGAIKSWEEGLEILMNLGHDENHPLVVSLAGHREIAQLLLSADANDMGE